jgi:hypothetical protein
VEIVAARPFLGPAAARALLSILHVHAERDERSALDSDRSDDDGGISDAAGGR